ncbi:ABC-F family ATP-binding cassette domain-containing protein [Oricola sp.]|uniref:ABC-F family ATP-binding cassette domain-containing protein n=1 Tax=Oricola sp. TaxID=1979950 RepID=UPI0025FCBCDF|nr:ABC-F family ATP-binding cassette domain-containing protein [Oricola sp.]MCI5075142.1 ABC-F family ATP-binding cassette domain-containing protein [Oricola sp.]
MATSPPLLRAENLTLTFGGAPLFSDVSFSVHAGDRIALVGRNGSGKSTLLRIAAGLSEAMDGEVVTEKNATIRYLPQDPDLSGFDTLGDYSRAELGPLDDPYRADQLLFELGLDPERAPSGLSGGEARRAALARTLAPEPDILFLDEPTNHLDLPAIEWLEDELARSRSAIVMISHDRRFLEKLSRRTLWLDRGVLRDNEAGFSAFEDWRDKLLEEEERDHHKLGRKIAREEHWVVHGVSGRRKRNMRRLGELAELRKSFREHQAPEGAAKLAASDARESGKLVIEATAIAKAHGDNTLVRDFSIRIHRGDRIGFVGPNGAGKTTLIRLLTGELEPDAGTVRLGANLDMAVLDQRRDALDPDETLEHFLTDGRGQSLLVNGEQKHVVSYMKDFLFKPEQARTPVRELSGGEKARLILARTLARPANLLVLDEPTNDLDMETLDLLQELVAGFPGTVLLVSHDRDFLDRTVNAVIAPDETRPGEGQWVAYAGGYSDMLAQRGTTQAGQRKSKVRPAASAKAETEAPRAAPQAAKSKLSYKQKYALETLPGRIEALDGEIAALEARLADPALFAKDPAGFNVVATELEGKRTTHAALEEEWLELEMLREEVEGG